MPAAYCETCGRLTAAFASLTLEAVAIQRDIQARFERREEPTQDRAYWSIEANKLMVQGLRDLQKHRRTHKEA
jgi:hypothetical protein